MKMIYTIGCIGLASLAGCIGQPRVRTNTDYSYEQVSNLKEYKTYCFLENSPHQSENEFDQLIRREVAFQMKLRGYTYLSPEHRPQFMISYFVYPEEVVIKGLNMPRLTQQQLTRPMSTDENFPSVKYRHKKGAMLIQLLDGNSHSVLWRGCASGEDYHNMPESRYVRREVQSIFDQFAIMNQNKLTTVYGE